MDDTIREGNIVQVKSGGSKMTVGGIGQYGMDPDVTEAYCVWLDEKGHRQEGHFVLSVLKKLEE